MIIAVAFALVSQLPVEPEAPAPPAVTSSTPPVAAVEPPAAVPVRDNAVYVIDPKVDGLPSSLRLTVASILAKAGADEGVSIFTSDDARAILDREAELQVLSADGDGVSLSELGKKVGARWVLASVVGKPDDDTLIEARLIDVERANVASRRITRASEYGGDFLEATRAAARLALSPIFASRQGTLTLTISEEGADVVVDEEQVGVAPLQQPLKLAGGTRLVVVKKQGFIVFREAVRMDKGVALTRDVVLRPSADFLESYRFTNGALRVGAWTTTAATVASAAAGLGFLYLFDQQNQVTRQLSTELEKGNEGVQIDEEQQAELGARVVASQNDAGLYGALASGGGTFAVVFAGTAIALWLFGQDPGRYDHLDDDAPGPAR